MYPNNTDTQLHKVTQRSRRPASHRFITSNVQLLTVVHPTRTAVTQTQTAGNAEQTAHNLHRQRFHLAQAFLLSLKHFHLWLEYHTIVQFPTSYVHRISKRQCWGLCFEPYVCCNLGKVKVPFWQTVKSSYTTVLQRNWYFSSAKTH